MRSTRARRVAASAVVPLLLLGVSACSDDEPGDVSAQPTPTESESPSDTVTDEPTDGSAPTEGEVVEDAAQLFEDMQAAMKDAGTARVAMDAGMGTASGLMDYSGDVPSMSLTTDLGGFSIEMRFVGGELYVSMPPARPGTFFKAGESDALGLNDALKNSSPSDSAADIAKALERLVRVGEEDIAGEATTHYVATVDTTKASMFGASPDLGENVPPVDIPKTLDIDLWLTEASLVRRIVMSLGAVNMQLDYTNWGEPVEIEAPAPGDIVEAPKGLGL